MEINRCLAVNVSFPGRTKYILTQLREIGKNLHGTSEMHIITEGSNTKGKQVIVPSCQPPRAAQARRTGSARPTSSG